MQYPQIQFYKGSLVRLASGKLKQVQDLSSDDFLESARLISSSSGGGSGSGSSSSSASRPASSASSASASSSTSTHQYQPQTSSAGHSQLEECEDFYADSSVVRDFLEVGPACSTSPNSPGSPGSSISSQPDSLTTFSQQQQQQLQSHTVLIKFFLESSRSTVFIEVPIEHPFFVFHRGWSSWNPQRTYDKFGLKCRKLKIGDTCISLIKSRKQPQQQQQQPNQQQQQESEQFNILFSSIKFGV